MKKHVYDDEKLALNAKVDGSPKAVAKIKTVDFVVTTKKGAVEAAEAPHSEPISVGFPDSKASYEYTPAKVDDDKDNYELRYEARIAPPGGSPLVKQGEDEYTIWPSTSEITFSSDDGKAHKSAKFKVVQRGKSSGIKTAADDGKWTERLEKATFSITMEPPWVFDGAVTHTGRKRTYKIKKSVYKFEFIEPVVTDAAVATKQYVNLDVDVAWSAEKPFGRELTFKVGAEGDTKRKPADRHAKQDDLVYIEIKFTPQTKRNDPQPKLLGDGLDGAAVDSDSMKTWKGKANLDASGQATFKVDLGFAGGDECEVKIGADDTCADASLKFVNWRRLFYELMYCTVMAPEMKDVGGGNHDIPDAIKTAADARLAAAFIEYQCSAYHKYAADAAPAGTLCEPEYVGQPAGGRKLVVLGGQLPVDDPVAFNAATARTIHVKMADATYSTNGGVQGPYGPDLDASPITKSLPNYSVPMSISVGGCVWRSKIPNPNLYKSMPTCTFTQVDSMDVVNRPYVVKIRETTQNKTLELTFERGDKAEPVQVLSGTEQAKIGPFILSLLTVAALRKQNNALVLEIGRPTNAGTITATVQAELTTSFNAQKVEIFTHPGLDEAGVARTGAMNVDWFAAVDHRQIKITLPAGENEPGSFIGPASATKCPVTVQFSAWLSGGINGNSGGGRQLFKLAPAPRTAGSMSSTLCHELGHSMGMTIMPGRSKIPAGTDAATTVDGGGKYYVDGTAPYNNGKRNLGKGPHCAEGVPVPDRASSTFNNKNGSCIMFHAGGDADTRPSFCDLCKTYLQARKLIDIRAGWAARSGADS